jgi:hypothetical protein
MEGMKEEIQALKEFYNDQITQLTNEYEDTKDEQDADAERLRTFFEK